MNSMKNKDIPARWVPSLLRGNTSRDKTISTLPLNKRGIDFFMGVVLFNKIKGGFRTAPLHNLLFFVVIFLLFTFTVLLPAHASPSTRGLVGYWRLDEGSGTTTEDHSTNNNTGTLTNGPTWTEGKFGDALQFDGDDAYVDLLDPSDGIFDFGTDDFTLSFYVKVPWVYGGVPWCGILRKGGTTSAPANTWCVYTNGSDVNILRYDDVNDTAATFHATLLSGSLRDGWRHIVIVRDGLTNYMYVDGSLVATDITADIANLDNSDNLQIGGQPNAAGSALNGAIDEVRIYNRALTNTEITNLYQETRVTVGVTDTANLRNGLVLHQTFDGPNMDWSNGSAEARDVSGEGNHGNVIGGAKPVAGRVGQCLEFDGVDDYVNVTTAAELEFNNTPFTICSWIKAFSQSDTTIGIFGNAEFQSGGYMLVDSSDRVGFVVNDDSAQLSEVSTDACLLGGDWVFAVGVFDGVYISLYVNGVLSSGPSAASVTISGSDFWIGNGQQGGWDEYFNGKIDDVRVYNRALSADEIGQLYNMGTVTVGKPQTDKYTNGLVLMQSFDGPDMDWSSSTAEAKDRSGNGNDGDVSGAKPVAGRVGQCLQFDGVNDYVVTSSYDFGSIDTLTFAGWIRHTDATVSAKQAFLYKKTAVFEIYVNADSKLVCNIGNGVWHSAAVSQAYSDWDSWHHCAATYDGANVRLYRDGMEIAVSGSETGNISDDGSFFRIGYSSDGVSYTDGLIDDVRAYNRALSAQEIEDLYHLGGGR